MIAAVAIVAMANADVPEEVTDLGGLQSLGGVVVGVAPAKEAKQSVSEQVGPAVQKASAQKGAEEQLAAERLVQVAEGAKAAGRRRRSRRVRSFTVKVASTPEPRIPEPGHLVPPCDQP